MKYPQGLSFPAHSTSHLTLPDR